jgi:hypothetical protein
VPGHGTTIVPQYYSFTDPTAGVGTWYYRLKQVDLDGSVHYSDAIRVDIVTSVSEPVPTVFALAQNFPNPFNPETQIRFSVESMAKTTLVVYDVLGRAVATLFNDFAEPGQFYTLRLDGTTLSTGMYFYKLQSGTSVIIRKMTLVK